MKFTAATYQALIKGASTCGSTKDAQEVLAEAQKDLQIRDSALRAERDATNVESTAGLIEYIAGFNMGWFRPTQ